MAFCHNKLWYTYTLIHILADYIYIKLHIIVAFCHNKLWTYVNGEIHYIFIDFFNTFTNSFFIKFIFLFVM